MNARFFYLVNDGLKKKKKEKKIKRERKTDGRVEAP